jgi:hypothetical protein
VQELVVANRLVKSIEWGLCLYHSGLESSDAYWIEMKDAQLAM